MQQLNNRQQLETDSLNVIKNFILLRRLINSADTTTPKLEIPVNTPALTISLEDILRDKNKLLPFLSAERKKMEAASNTSRSKAANNQVNLTASYGLTNAAVTIPAIYQSPNDQQRFTIGFSVPLLTWGKRKNSIGAARLQEKQTELSNKTTEEIFRAEIKTILITMPQLKKNIEHALASDSLTGKLFTITHRLYQSGKASLVEVQAAQTAKENARRNYVAALRSYWENYYLLKAKTGINF